MAIYGLTSGTFIVTGVVIATLLAVTYETFTYRGGGITPHAGDQTATRAVRLTPVIAPAKGEGRRANVGRRGLFNSRHQIASHAVRLTRSVRRQPKEKPMADPVPSGSDVSAGTYTCTQCGYELTTGSTESLPPCPECSNGSWNTVTGGDSASDPAS